MLIVLLFVAMSAAMYVIMCMAMCQTVLIIFLCVAYVFTDCGLKNCVFFLSDMIP